MIIVGLGNPGSQFENTRHNTGFMAIDFFAQKNGFPEFTDSKKHQAFVSEKDGVTLVKPQTFMNESGKSVRSIIKNTNNDLVIIHDDIDVALGSIKIVKNRGSAGHKGVDSIIQAIGNEELVRIRVGICPVDGKPTNSEKFVIEKFKPEEMEIMNQTVEKVSHILGSLQQRGLEQTMNTYN